MKRTSSARIEKQRKLEFLDQDVQFDESWAKFLIEHTKKASQHPDHYWEGSANATCIIINGDEVRLKPLYDQYPDDLVLRHKDFIDQLEGWLAARRSRFKQ